MAQMRSESEALHSTVEKLLREKEEQPTDAAPGVGGEVQGGEFIRKMWCSELGELGELGELDPLTRDKFFCLRMLR